VLCCAAEHTAEPAILSTLLATDQSNTHTHTCAHTHTHTHTQCKSFLDTHTAQIIGGDTHTHTHTYTRPHSCINTLRLRGAGNRIMPASHMTDGFTIKGSPIAAISSTVLGAAVCDAWSNQQPHKPLVNVNMRDDSVVYVPHMYRATLKRADLLRAQLRGRR
jgi:hypothetical protein